MSGDAPNTPPPAALPARLTPLGPWALITGASDGIGAATARALAEHGFNVILVARRKARLETLAKEITTAHGVQAHAIPADLGQPEGVERMAQALAQGGVSLNDIGVAVLAAGYGTTGALAEADLAAERDMLRVNCDAILQFCHLFATSMAARGAGHMVLFGSIVGFQGNAMAANYAATKAYVQALAEGLAVEMRPSGVTVQAVAPGPIATGFAARAGMTVGQAGSPETVARAIVRRLGRSGTIRPGLLSKVLGYNLAMTPRPLRIRIMSQIISGMAKGKPSAAPAQNEA
ncbi:MAG: SDR family NAD(P)-dependent oxidoreductase [Pseudomonadota bacterium]